VDGDRPVSDVGEQGLIERFAQVFGPPASGEIWSGDDAALLRSPSDTLVFTTDMLVEDVDFDLAYCTGADVGWKLVACNASDAAAMGAAPRFAVATLALPPDTRLSFVDDLAHGIADAARRWGMNIVGGDISRAAAISASLALVAAPFGGGVTLRSGAQPGDAICTTGALGGSAAGLIVLQRGLVDLENVRREIATPSGADGLAVLAARHLRPSARVQEADRIGRVGITAAVDISDGLALDLSRLMRASGTGCDVDSALVPVDPEIASLSARGIDGAPDGVELAVTGGEDFELLFTVVPGKVGETQLALDDIGVPVTQIGIVTDGEMMIGGRPLEGWSEAGWDHLRTR
jgi:thiamine-monophosphate kinase